MTGRNWRNSSSKIGALPGPASVAVICPTPDTVRAWFELMAPSLESAFRNPIISDRGRLTERLKTHFTTPTEAKGLEFDVAVVPDLSDFATDIRSISMGCMSP